MILATGSRIVVRRPRRINTGETPLVADEMTVGRRLHRLLTAGTRHAADAMTAGPHRYLGLAEMTIDGTTLKVVTGVIVANRHPSPGGIVGAATRFRGRHLVSVLRHTERADRTRTVLVITTAEDMIHGTDTGITAVGEYVYHRLLYVSASCHSELRVYPVFLKVLLTGERSSTHCVITYVDFTKDPNLAAFRPSKHR